jgi:octaprenyl-diphosphate synthase
MAALKNKQLIDLKEVKTPVEKHLTSLDHLITASLVSKIPLINAVVTHIIDSGGKRLRPLLTLLMAQTLRPGTNTEAITIATGLEFIHTATLLHDDVIDHSELRRGKTTANSQWSNSIAILIGDLLYSRAFELLVKLNINTVTQSVSETANLVTEGEIMQLSNQRQLISKASYLSVIIRKTATLFACASECAAVATKQPDTNITAAKEFGLQLGILFQFIDDILDYTADTATLGKNIGDDITEGKMTLPLIYAFEKGNTHQQQIIKTAIEKDQYELQTILQVIQETNAIELCQNDIRKHHQLALTALDQLKTSQDKTPLKKLLAFAISRQY